MKINRIKLLTALEKVRSGISSEGCSAIEQSQCVVFEKDRLCSFNDEVAVIHPGSYGIEGAIVAAPLIELLKRITEEIIDVRVTDSDLVVSDTRIKAGIRKEQEVTLPLHEIGKTKEWKKIPGELAEAISFCQFSAASKDYSRPALTFIHIVGNIVESCDNFRLTRFEMKEDIQDPLLVPVKAVKELTKYSFKEYGVVPGWVQFKDADGVIYACRTFSEDYPNLASLLECEGMSLSLPKGLTESLSKAELFVDKDLPSDFSDRVTIKVTANRLDLLGRGQNGWFTERFKINYKGEAKRFDIHPKFLKDSLKLCNSVVISDKKLKLSGDSFVHIVSLSSEKEGETSS